jgi:hypothetical protein
LQEKGEDDEVVELPIQDEIPMAKMKPEPRLETTALRTPRKTTSMTSAMDVLFDTPIVEETFMDEMSLPKKSEVDEVKATSLPKSSKSKCAISQEKNAPRDEVSSEDEVAERLK